MGENSRWPASWQGPCGKATQTMDDREQLIERLREAARKVFDGTAVFLAYAHGSRIHGAPRPGSDLDVAYYAGGYPHPQALPLGEDLSLAVALGQEMHMEVDLRCFDRAPLPMRGRLLEHGVRIYCTDEVARVNLERDLLTEWLDWKPTYRRLCEAFLDRVAERGLSHGR
jgi:predicted nucleotidyltransferase